MDRDKYVDTGPWVFSIRCACACVCVDHKGQDGSPYSDFDFRPSVRTVVYLFLSVSTSLSLFSL